MSGDQTPNPEQLRGLPQAPVPMETQGQFLANLGVPPERMHAVALMQTTYLLIAVLQACGGSVVLPDDWTTKCGMGKPNQGMDEPVALTKWLPEGGYKVYVTTLGEATAPRRNN